jgi:hypothetical protein
MAAGKDSTGPSAWFVPDTNFFLQYLPPEQVAWSMVTDAAHIRLVVVRTVQKEIDELKGGGNARKAARARKASALLKSTMRAPDGVLLLKDKGPRVSLQLGPRLPGGRAYPEGLDRDISDDRIVEETMATAVLMGERLRLLTGDGGPMMTAREIGLDFAEVPDTWALPVEPDTESKRIQELERQVRVLSAKVPEIEVEFLQGGGVTDILRGVVDETTVLSDDFLAQMQKAVLDRHPIKDSNSGLGVRIYREDEWETYRAQYVAWAERLPATMEATAKLIDATLEPVHFRFHINNTGAATAEHPRVEIVPKGPLSLMVLSQRDTLAKLYEGRVFPSPPSAPSGITFTIPFTVPTGIETLPRFHGPESFEVPVTLGKEFSWVFDDPQVASQKAVGECLELRHGLDGETFDFYVIPAPGESGPVTGSISVRVSARNLPEPLTIQIRVEIERRQGNGELRIREKLKASLGLLFLPGTGTA